MLFKLAAVDICVCHTWFINKLPNYYINIRTYFVSQCSCNLSTPVYKTNAINERETSTSWPLISLQRHNLKRVIFHVMAKITFIKFRFLSSDAQLDTVNKSSYLYLQIVRLFNTYTKKSTSFSITVISPTLSTSSLSPLHFFALSSPIPSLFHLYFLSLPSLLPLNTQTRTEPRAPIGLYTHPNTYRTTSSLWSVHGPKHAQNHAPKSQQ